MANFNRVIVAGNLTRDPELRYVEVGEDEVAVCDFGIAVGRIRAEGVDFFQVTAWRELAEVVEEYKKKGDGILVEGRLQYSAWENGEGEKRSRVTIVAENVQFLGIAGAGESQDDDFDDLDDLDPQPAARSRSGRSARGRGHSGGRRRNRKAA